MLALTVAHYEGWWVLLTVLPVLLRCFWGGDVQTAAVKVLLNEDLGAAVGTVEL